MLDIKKERVAEDIVFNIYKDLYKHSNPSANFDELFEKAETDEDGQKIIDCDAYEIDDELMDKIVLKHLNKNQIKKDSYLWKIIKTNVYLGFSPKTIIKYS